MYGLVGGKQQIRRVALKVCDVLGNGKNNMANKLLLETCGAETNFGLVKDLTINGGLGIAQFDEKAFYDVKDRTRAKHKTLLKNELGIDVDLVDWQHLRYNVVLSLVFARLKYKLVPETIPLSLEGRANYWKKYYNSVLGKGTIKHYVDVNKI